MKHKLVLLFPFFLVCASLSAQFNWQHTNGPEGGLASGLFNSDSFLFFNDNYHLYRSNDGATWEKLPHPDVWPIASFGNILAAQQGFNLGYPLNLTPRFIISHDNGSTWLEGTMPPGVQSFRSLVFCSHGIYVADGSHKIVFRSQDEGLTWDSLVAPIQYADDIYEFEDRVYLSTPFQAFRTDINGENWTQCSPQYAPEEYGRRALAIGQNLIVSTKTKLWYSNDDGQTWASHSSPYPNDFRSLESVGNVVYARRGLADIYKSVDFGQTWVGLPPGPPYPGFRLLSSLNNQLFVATFDRGVYRWDEPTQQFFQANSGLQSARVNQLAAAGNNLWANTGNGLFQFNRLQETWSTNPSLPPSSDYFSFLSANETGLVVRGELQTQTFSLSKNGGQTWNEISWPFNSWSSSTIDLKVLDNNVFTGWQGAMFRSGNAGVTWTQMPGQINSIVKFKNLYMSYNLDKFWASSDQGLTWVLHSSIPATSIWGIYSTDDLLFAFMATPQTKNRGRIHVSTDGITWKYAHDGLPSLDFSNFTDFYKPASYFGVDGKYFIYHPSAGFIASKDTCKTWVLLEKRPDNWVALSDSVFYTGAVSAGVFSSGVPNIYDSMESGLLYSDDNNNGMPDAGESPLPDIAIGLQAPRFGSPFHLANTNANGLYTLAVIPAISDTIRPLIQSNYVESINPPYYLVGNGGTNLDFGVKLTPNVHDLSITGVYLGRPRPGFQMPISIRYKNAGSVDQDAVVSIKLDPNLAFVDATPPPTAVFGDSLAWSISALKTFYSDNILLNTKVLPSTQLGTIIASNCRISSLATDFTPADNLRILSDTAVGVYAPNAKRVEPADGLTAAEIAAGVPLYYTIQFQNTGTAEVNRVRITDMLDILLDLPSLRFESASHPVHTFRLLPSGLLEIIFENIMLPDSNTNEAESHGYVTFSILRKKGYPPSYFVRNEALIYFDFNEPIFTNIVKTLLKSSPVSVQTPMEKESPALVIYPNPAQDAFSFSAEKWLSGSGQLSIVSTAGQLCQQRPIADLSQTILVQTAGLPDGVYFIRLSGKDKSIVGKVVVRH